MTSDDRRRKGERLKRARLGSGFKSALAAAEHYGWPKWTYAAREQGNRPMDDASAVLYAAAFTVPTDYICLGDESLPSKKYGRLPAGSIRDENRLLIIYRCPLEKILSELEKLGFEGEIDSLSRLRLARRMAGFRTATDAAQYFGIGLSTYMAHENGQNRFGNTASEAYGEAFSVDAAWLLGQRVPSGLPTTPDWGDHEWSRIGKVASTGLRPGENPGRRGDPTKVRELLAVRADSPRDALSRDDADLTVTKADGTDRYFVDLRLSIEHEGGSVPMLRSCTIDEVEVAGSWITSGDVAVVDLNPARRGTGRLMMVERGQRKVLRTVEGELDQPEAYVGDVIRIIKSC